MKRKLIVGAVIFALLAPGLLMAQGELTLEGLSAQVENLTSRVAGLFTTQDELVQRLAAVETAIAPTPTNTTTPTATATPSPTVTPLPEVPLATINRTINVRRGPGTHHAVIGRAEGGEQFPIIGKNIAGDWWQIDFRGQEAWIYAPYTTASDVGSVQVVPTPTAVPTERPTPSPTRAPTETPRPTATPDKRQEDTYRSEVGRILLGDGSGWDVSSSMTTIGEKFTEASENPFLILNDDWKIGVALAMAGLRASYQDAQELSPPRNLRNFHDLLVEGLSYCAAATDWIARGVDEFDLEAIEEGAGLIQLCSSTIQRAASDPNW